MAATSIIVVFDFDHTMIDDNSDTWIVEKMGLTSVFNQLRRKLPWNSLMDKMMEELHSSGKTIEDIAECLKQIPMNSTLISAIHRLKSIGYDLRIVSDANQFFIDTILEHYGLVGCFSEIITNGSFVDDEGRLKILPYNSLDLPHGCSLCPSNLCKGLVIDKIQASMVKGEKIIMYIGDGGGDYCPSLRLVEGDYILPKKDFPLWKKINGAHNSSILVKAMIQEWVDGEELGMTILRLCNI
ncbi:thiamine phosphate phosphatase-like protein [Impatiens glandulifera]|uniref:thiamine phosphate phosphatase-like protein n=1 Tax=Impatiens glandulifera TaxID=253017 RepID=UPI001FB12F7C|nr:thiamine phosphate phosphatase-like protein [Impatiens glandulifera]